jgi:MYXO-CTERM domain-containing protein
MTSPLLWDTDSGGASDGSEDANLNGVVDSGETIPTSGNGADDGSVIDGDGDGLGDDLEEFLGSNPQDADSDEDGLLDGLEPNPSADTDGDGDRNIVDVDSDDDGLFDGTEAGKDCDDAATDATAGFCVEDADSGATTTNPLLADTDGGGVADGVEDTNHNGMIDAGERDPNDPSDDMIGEDCTTDVDCGGPTSGVVCDDGTCALGCRGEGGNGCPAGEVCTSVDETIGECVLESDGGTGGSAGSAGSAGAAGSAGSGVGGTAGSGGGAGSGGTAGTGGSAGADGGLTPEDDGTVLEGGGCSCSVPTSGNAPLGLGLVAALGALWAARRRRDR